MFDGKSCAGGRSAAVLGVAALVVSGLAAVLTGDVAAATSVDDELSFRAAFTDAGETDIDLTDDITLTCGGGGLSSRTSTVPLEIDGNGHTITQSCAANGVLSVFAPAGQAGELTLRDVTITGGQKLGNGGALASSGAVTVIGSTIHGNTANFQGGGIATLGTVTLINSTVSGNTAASTGGGVIAEDITLVYATVTGNAGFAGDNLQIGGVTTLVSFGSVVADPADGGENCGFSFGQSTVSHGYNWDDDGTCGFGAGPGDHSDGGDPQLEPLADNGGPSETQLPAPGSGLLDAIPFASCQGDGASGITTDQRGLPRPSPVNGACDIGAVEVQVVLPLSPPVPRFTG